MKTVTAVCSLLLVFLLMVGCGSSKSAFNPDPLNPKNVNLVFTVSEDLAYQAPGDINPKTANLTNQGLQRSLQTAAFLRQSVLGKENVNGIYALQPMSHLQTTNNFPDMVAIESIQQFAMLNQATLSSSAQGCTCHGPQLSPQCLLRGRPGRPQRSGFAFAAVLGLPGNRLQ